MKLNEEKKKNEKLKSHYKFSSEEKKNLISIEFRSFKQDIQDFHIIIKDTELFSNVEKILYEYYPQYKTTKNYFLCNANPIDKNKTFKENNIKNDSILNLEIDDLNY